MIHQYRKISTRIAVVALVSAIQLASSALCHAREGAVGVLISREIAPYITMVEGLEDGLGSLPVHRFFLDEQGLPYTLGGGGSTLDPSRYSVLVAVGPEALRYLLSRGGPAPLVHAMVLNPEKVISAAERTTCGVSLNLPFTAQLAAIRKFFPGKPRLGILFDPANNQEWFDAAFPAAASVGMQLVPIQVVRKEGKLEVATDFANVDILLFIPDKTIISKAFIQHVIKKAALHRIPVAGYNQFFHDSGAALNFIIDYTLVGGQAASHVQGLLAGEKCQDASAPAFSIKINDEAWRALGLKTPGGRP